MKTNTPHLWHRLQRDAHLYYQNLSPSRRGWWPKSSWWGMPAGLAHPLNRNQKIWGVVLKSGPRAVQAAVSRPRGAPGQAGTVSPSRMVDGRSGASWGAAAPPETSLCPCLPPPQPRAGQQDETPAWQPPHPHTSGGCQKPVRWPNKGALSPRSGAPRPGLSPGCELCTWHSAGCCVPLVATGPGRRTAGLPAPTSPAARGRGRPCAEVSVGAGLRRGLPVWAAASPSPCSGRPAGRCGPSSGSRRCWLGAARMPPTHPGLVARKPQASSGYGWWGEKRSWRGNLQGGWLAQWPACRRRKEWVVESQECIARSTSGNFASDKPCLHNRAILGLWETRTWSYRSAGQAQTCSQNDCKLL